MRLATDSREQAPLVFPVVAEIEQITMGLAVGDYTAFHGEQQDTTVCERKSLSDLFTSFTGNYDAERNKILKAKELGLTYILAIEASFSEVLKGHSYWKQGEVHESKKSGLAMIRQLMTLQRKYGIQVWFCQSRKEMAIMIQEYFLAQERVKE